MNTKLIKYAALLTIAGVLTSLHAQPAGGPPPGMPPGGMPTGMPPGIPPEGMPPMPPSEPVVYHPAVDIDGGTIKVGPMSEATVRGNASSAKAARKLTIQSEKDRVNGLLVRGKADFTLSDSSIALSGKGKSDFDGISAGVLTKDQANVVLKNVKITTRGVVSSAATATDASTLKVYHSRLVSEGGPVPSAYVRRLGPGMMEPPTPLGIVGTARATLVLGSAKAYYYDSEITADGWGAMSTDAARGAYLEVNRSKITVRRSGYGTYSDNGASVVINDSIMDVATFGGIIAGQASLALNNLRLKSGGNAVMIHSVMGYTTEVAELNIKGGDLRSTNAAIVVKSANAKITIDGTKIVTGNGDILLASVNDDSFATKVNGKKVAGTNAVIRNSKLDGNIINVDTDRGLQVRLEQTQLRGVVKNTTLSFGTNSQWTATAPSQVVLDGAVAAGQIDAPAGVEIQATGTGHGLSMGRHVLKSGGTLIIS